MTALFHLVHPAYPGPVQFSDTVSETINAVRSNKKATATGTISGHFNIGTFDATVNFISVSGTEACAAATVTDSTISGVDPGAGVIFSVKDGGSPGALDLARTSFLPDNPGGCSFDITSPSGVTSGDIQVTDNHNP